MDNDSHKIMEAFVYFGQKKEKPSKSEEGELMSHMKEKGMISKDASTDTGKYGRNREEEERRLDPKCWKGYHKEGTKKKGDKRVNNCVKNQDEEMPAPTFWDILSKMKQKSGGEKTFADYNIDDLSKEDSREQYTSQDYAKDSEGEMSMRDIKGENEESLPSLYQFHKMLQNFDSTYEYSDDPSAYRRGRQQHDAISKAIEKGGKPYQDLYNKMGKEDYTAPQKSREEVERDTELLRSFAEKLKEISQTLFHDIDENSVTHPQQLWDIYYPVFHALKAIKDIAQTKGFKHVLKSLNEHNI